MGGNARWYLKLSMWKVALHRLRLGRLLLSRSCAHHGHTIRYCYNRSTFQLGRLVGDVVVLWAYSLNNYASRCIFLLPCWLDIFLARWSAGNSSCLWSLVPQRCLQRPRTHRAKTKDISVADPFLNNLFMYLFIYFYLFIYLFAYNRETIPWLATYSC